MKVFEIEVFKKNHVIVKDNGRVTALIDVSKRSYNQVSYIKTLLKTYDLIPHNITNVINKMCR